MSKINENPSVNSSQLNPDIRSICDECYYRSSDPFPLDCRCRRIFTPQGEFIKDVIWENDSVVSVPECCYGCEWELEPCDTYSCLCCSRNDDSGKMLNDYFTPYEG